MGLFFSILFARAFSVEVGIGVGNVVVGVGDGVVCMAGRETVGFAVIGSIFGRSVMLGVDFNMADDFTHSTLGAIGVGVSLNCSRALENNCKKVSFLFIDIFSFFPSFAHFV